MKFSVGLSAFAIGAVLAAAPVLGASVTIGGNGGLLGTGILGGGSSQPNTVSVNTNVGGTGSVGSGNAGLLGTGLLSGGNSQDTTANLSVNGGNGTLLNLFGDGQQGSGQQTATANVNLGSGSASGNGDGNVLLNLFGTGGNTGTNADITVGGLNGGPPAVGSGGVPGDVTLDLFGGGSSAGSTNGDGSAVTPVGSTSGGGAGEIGGSGIGTGGGAIGAGTGIKLASIDARAGAACFTPNANQLATLAGRHDYGPGTFADWTGVTTIKVIPTGICKSALHDISAQTNIGELQTYFGTDAALKAQLAKWGHAPGDVIAVDRQGSTLIVYVG